MQPLHKEGLPHVCWNPNALKSPQPGIRTFAPSHQPHWHTKSILTLNTNNRGRSRQTSLVNNKRKQANPCIGISKISTPGRIHIGTNVWKESVILFDYLTKTVLVCNKKFLSAWIIHFPEGNKIRGGQIMPLTCSEPLSAKPTSPWTSWGSYLPWYGRFYRAEHEKRNHTPQK